MFMLNVVERTVILTDCQISDSNFSIVPKDVCGELDKFNRNMLVVKLCNLISVPFYIFIYV